MVQLLIEVLLVLCVLILNAAVMLLGWMPRILRALGWLAQMILVVSCDLYRVILTWLKPLGRRVGISLMTNPWRTVTCMLISMLFGLAIVVLVGWDITPPGIGISAGHGFLVGMVWDQMGPPSGIRMGV